MLALPVAMLFPALWAQSPSRSVAVLVSAGYFLAASRGLPHGVANFYAADLWPGLLLWLAASASFVIVHAALWTRRPGKAQSEAGRPARYLAAMIVTALPPFGVTGCSRSPPLACSFRIGDGGVWQRLLPASR